MTLPEQPVLDEIDRLVSWQIEEGQRRGDGPERSLCDLIMSEFLSDLGDPSTFAERMRQFGFIPTIPPPPGGFRIGWQHAH